jgi:hypothetical protein
MLLTSPVRQLVLGVKLLAADAVQAPIVALVDVVAPLARPPECDRALDVPSLEGRPNEVVVGDGERLGELCEDPSVAVHKLLGRDTFALGGLDVLETVLVGAGQEPRIGATQALVAGERVGLDHLQRVPDVGSGVDVGNRGGDVERLAHPDLPRRRVGHTKTPRSDRGVSSAWCACGRGGITRRPHGPADETGASSRGPATSLPSCQEYTLPRGGGCIHQGMDPTY